MCIFPPYPRSLSAEKSRKSKGAAGCQPTPRPTALAGTMRATLQPIAHAESFLAAFSAPSQLLARLPLMRRHYSTSRETCFFHDNYPSLCEGRSSNGVLLEREGSFSKQPGEKSWISNRRKKSDTIFGSMQFSWKGEFYLSKNIDETRRLYNI